jgi:hypothetical protein
MAMKIDDVVAQLLALPAEDRAKIIARVQASFVEDSGNVTAVARSVRDTDLMPMRLLDLAGTGRGMWGEDSAAYLRHLRDEWH